MLPPELVHYILSFVDEGSFRSAMYVNHKWKITISDCMSSLWRRIFYSKWKRASVLRGRCVTWKKKCQNHKGDYETITEAIQCADAEDVIVVRSGVYNEGLLISKVV